MKTKLYKAVLLAALGLGGITSVQAQDALLGFNDAGGTGNDYVIDLGSGSQFTTTATIDFSSQFTMFTTAFGTTPDANVAAGFVSQVGSSSILQSYAGGTPNLGGLTAGNPSGNQALAARAAASGILTGVYASSLGQTGSGNAWSYNIAANPTTAGLTTGISFAADTANPMGTLTGGQITLALYESTIGSGRNAPGSTWTEVGTLAIDANAGTAIYTGIAAVPEPTTFSLLGGAGLLLISLRNKFSRKQA